MNWRFILPAAALFGIVTPLHAGEPGGINRLWFLIGTWRSTGSGAPGDAHGTAEFAPSLGGRVIIRKSYAEYPLSPGKPAYRHDDLMVISAGADSTITADYYDNEGHVIRYRVSVPSPGNAEFLSQPDPAGPRYRLTYSLEGKETLNGRFEVAPSGGDGKFRTYLQWSSHK